MTTSHSIRTQMIGLLELLIARGLGDATGVWRESIARSRMSGDTIAEQSTRSSARELNEILGMVKAKRCREVHDQSGERRPLEGSARYSEYAEAAPLLRGLATKDSTAASP